MGYNKETRKKYLELNKQKIAGQKKLYYNSNKESLLENQKKWNRENKAKIREYQRNKMSSDILYKLKNNVKNYVKNSLKNLNFKKSNNTIDILGCSFYELKLHIENQFEPWMNWNNYGNPKDGIYELYKTWDIDHIIPLATAKDICDILKLSHYTNLQPLCSYTNRFIKRNGFD